MLQDSFHGSYFTFQICFSEFIFSALTKWSNTLKQIVGCQPANFLSGFDHFVWLVLKGLTHGGVASNPDNTWNEELFKGLHVGYLRGS